MTMPITSKSAAIAERHINVRLPIAQPIYIAMQNTNMTIRARIIRLRNTVSPVAELVSIRRLIVGEIPPSEPSDSSCLSFSSACFLCLFAALLVTFHIISRTARETTTTNTTITKADRNIVLCRKPTTNNAPMPSRTRPPSEYPFYRDLARLISPFPDGAALNLRRFHPGQPFWLPKNGDP